MRPTRSHGLGVILALTLLAGAAAIAWTWRGATAHGDATFVGAARCARCHAAEYAAWKTSQHARAMQLAGPGAVLGRFDGERLTHDGITSTFLRRGDKYVVNTEGADGALHDYDIRYTFGVYPLQQYIVAIAGGRLNPLPQAWDARPTAEGGQRWFSLEPTPRPTDELHWAARYTNWNYMCADCHSTGVRKGYDAATDSFRTAFAEINVGCEGCHGPSSRHVEWARWPRVLRRLVAGGSETPPARFTERRGVRWATDSSGRTITRNVPRTTDREIETCAQCHARRAHIAEGYSAGARFVDYYEPLLLMPGLYFPDGQQRDEVYTYASFLQSRMYAAGVTCADCHEPHSARLRYTGNQTCTQCHRAERYDTTAHHFHAPRSAGASCVGCHMPDATFMEIDRRHDHSLRVPRPDLSVQFGVPNACTRCHADRDLRWAARKVQAWYGAAHVPAGFQRFTNAFAADERGDMGAADSLLRVADDRTESIIARASALERLARYPGAPTLEAAQRGAVDAHPLVRRAALVLLDAVPPRQRIAIAAPLLADSTRMVRQGAAWALARVADSLATAKQKGDFARAASEFVASQRYNADRAESRLTLGAFYAARGQLDSAATESRAAMRLAPRNAQGYLNLAGVLNAQGKRADAEHVLSDGLAQVPANAELAFARVVALAELGRTREARAAVDALRARHLRERDVQRAAAALDSALRRLP